MTFVDRQEGALVHIFAGIGLSGFSGATNGGHDRPPTKLVGVISGWQSGDDPY